MRQLDEVRAMIQTAINNKRNQISFLVSKADKDRYDYILKEFTSVGYRSSFRLKDFEKTNRLPVVLEW